MGPLALAILGSQTAGCAEQYKEATRLQFLHPRELWDPR